MIKSKPLELNINVPEYVGIQNVPSELNIHMHEYVRKREVIKHIHMQYLVISPNLLDKCIADNGKHIRMIGATKINHLSTKNANFLPLLYHNIITIYTIATKSTSLLQNLMRFLLQLMEMRFHSERKILIKYNSV